MKNLIVILVLFITVNLSAQFGFDYYLNSTSLDTNNIRGYLNNYGSTQSETGFIGFNWNQLPGFDQTIVYDQGIWVVGKIENQIKLTIDQWRFTQSPGPIIDGQSAMIIHPEDSLKYRIYKINKGDDDTNPDYAEWPIDFGAPINSNGTPKVYSDQTHWCVYNGYDSNVFGRTSNMFNDTIPPIPVEIQQLVYIRKGNESDFQDIFSNTVFLEYTIINKGQLSIDSTYIGFWTDIDFTCPNYKNLPAFDQNKQLGYCWSNGNNSNGITPAVGYTLLYGPLKESNGSSAIFKGRKLENYENLPLYSFHGIGDDGGTNPLTGIARSAENAWYFANGLDGNGNVITNPVTNLPTKFPFDGDPVTNSGWLFPSDSTGGGAGFVFFSGPFNLAPNDTQWVMVALVPALGNNNLESIELLREKVQLLRSLPYDSLAFGVSSYFVTDVNDTKAFIPTEFSLSQNYPNPFNPVTTIKYTIPNVTLSGVEGSRVVLKVYDILGSEIATLVNKEQSAGNYEVDFKSTVGNLQLASGIYFYRLQAGSFVQTKKMVLIK